MFSGEELGLAPEVNPLSPQLGGDAYREYNVNDQNHQQHKEPYDLILNEYQPSFVSSPAQSFHRSPKLKSIQSGSQELVKPAKETPSPFALSSLEILSNYASGSKKMKTKQSNHPTNDETTVGGRRKLSTEEIIRVAGARYIQFSDQSFDDFSTAMHPFGYALSGLSEEETRDVELVHLLLAGAEKLGYQQYERTNRLLSRCEWTAAERANSLQRVVYYFAEALRRRMDKETGRFTTEELSTKTTLTDRGLGYNIKTLKCYQKLPFYQVLYYAAIQTINENVADASKIHVIDFEIRSGAQWTTFMQALAQRNQRPIQRLKITAVGFKIQEKELEEVDKWLSSFAESLNIPFSFKIVCISCYFDIKQEIFQIRNDESLVVYCSLILRMMLPSPSCLENLLGVIKKLSPSIVVIIEIEANHNSSSFVTRFTESLFFYGAYFDSLETCLDQDIETRTAAEDILNKSAIRNIVLMEGTDRINRSVKVDVWRAFLSRFKMVEIGFSDSCLYQTDLVLKTFPHASCCNLERNGKSLITGWKGTPIHSLSVWKFQREYKGLFNFRV